MAVSTIKRTPTVANNLTTTTEGSVLDARQGKALSDKIANLSNAWILLDTVQTATENRTVDLPSSFNELFITAHTTETGSGTLSTVYTSAVIASNMLDSNVKRMRFGSYATSTTGIQMAVQVTSTTIKLDNLYINGTTYTSKAVFSIYYR